MSDVVSRARLSLGRADEAIHALVARLLAARQASGTLADVGCGTGNLARVPADSTASSASTRSATTACLLT